MKNKDLILELQKLDPEMDVVFADAEWGWTSIQSIKVLKKSKDWLPLQEGEADYEVIVLDME